MTTRLGVGKRSLVAGQNHPPNAALDSVRAELAELERTGLRRWLPATSGGNGTMLTIAGKSAVNFCSNNYLGLADHPVLVEAAAAAMAEGGVGAGAARLVTGNLPLHRQLEADLALWTGTKTALLFNSGYHANIGVLGALAGPHDAIYSDAFNHASIIDGCRLSRAAVHVYPHADIAALAHLLCGGRRFRRRIVVTESLFSMDGDQAPLAALRELSHAHGAFLVVDDAHAVGLLGPSGSGLCHGLGVDLQVGTLGKALGVFGAYAAGDSALIDLLLNRARSFIFTTALPVPVVAAARAALRVVRSGDGEVLRDRLARNATRLRAGLIELGLASPGGPALHLTRLVVGDPVRASALSQRLLDLGFFLQAIRPPTVPAGTSRLRLTLMATHTPAQIDALLAALSPMRTEFVA